MLEEVRLQKTRHEQELLSQILKWPEMSYSILPQANLSLDPEIQQQVEITIKYQGYIDRQENEVQKIRSMEATNPNLDELSDHSRARNEARQKLSDIQPHTLGQFRVFQASPQLIFPCSWFT